MKKEVKMNLFSHMEFGWLAESGKFYVSLTNENIDPVVANETAHEMMRFARTYCPHIEPEFKITDQECRILLSNANEDSYRIVGGFIDGCVEKSRIMKQFGDLRIRINKGEI